MPQGEKCLWITSALLINITTFYWYCQAFFKFYTFIFIPSFKLLVNFLKISVAFWQYYDKIIT